jgi:antitoxin component of MazEF toxin-antitoxin module
MEKTIVKRGNGAAIPMTKDMLEILGVRVGEAIQVRFEGRRMIITPATRVVSDEEFDEAMEAVLDQNADALAKLAE